MRKATGWEKLEITDEPVEFECPVCGRTVIYPSPESASMNPSIIHPVSIYMECSKCGRTVCGRCVGDKKRRLCRECAR